MSVEVKPRIQQAEPQESNDTEIVFTNLPFGLPQQPEQNPVNVACAKPNSEKEDYLKPFGVKLDLPYFPFLAAEPKLSKSTESYNTLKKDGNNQWTEPDSNVRTDD